MSDTTVQVQPGEKPAEPLQESKQEKTLPQSEVNRIVEERVQRERAKYADYDDLKARAGKAATAEERIAALENDLTSTKTEALRSRIAARFGVSTEPGEDGKSDADLFLTGTDEDTLTTQAKRLAARESERKANGNVAPNEGASKNQGSGDGEKRQFVSGLFGQP